MKKEIKPSSRGFFVLYRAALVLFLFLALILAGGTLYAFLRGDSRGPLFSIGGRKSGAARTADAKTGDSAESVFNGMGRLRIALSGGQTLILSIAFPYPPDDQAFTEELAAKVPRLRSLASEYFASLPAGASAAPDEDKAKKEITARWNAELRLGRIETLYFSDLMIID